MRKAFEIRISGIVQGVGYRPFVYKTAASMNMSGFVANTGGEVLIHAEGIEEHLDSFIAYLRNNCPEGSRIQSFNVSQVEAKHFIDFKIIKSIQTENASIVIPPDISICEDCLKDISDQNSRFYNYSFTSCTKCGPRFSIISTIPYDRENTSMKNFEMCEDCKKEYENPENRRHHAQTICCSKCGPSFKLFDNNGIEQEEQPFEKTRMLVKQGFIIAVKGIGGFHLICDAKNIDSINKLRERKNRPAKPFAVMIKNINKVREYCCINEEEETILRGREKPIVLLEQKRPSSLSEFINPGLNRLGVMLPYSGIHEQLFDHELDAIVATSGNKSGLPLIINNNKAFEQLKDIADYFLIHNREILNRCDDSIISKNQFIRRARGYAPASIKCSTLSGSSILACGADLKNAFALFKGDTAHLSQYIGELDSLETYEAFKETVEKYKILFDIAPKIIACDMHPDYHTTKFAEKSGQKVVKVQHHYAHIASVIAEHGIKNEIIGVAFDGTGYGDDNTIWGGEFFVASLKDYIRFGHLRQVVLPGGDRAAKEPWRMAGVYLLDSFGPKYTNLRIPAVKELENRSWGTLVKTINSGINAVRTSSAGRLFDAISAILGICFVNTYEGQAAAELEAAADRMQRDFFEYEIPKGEKCVVDYRKTIISIVKEIEAGRSISEIAGKFHNTIAKSITEMCYNTKKETGLNTVALNGGVFQNQLLLEKTTKLLEDEGFKVYTNRIMPCNDGGILLGQIAVANQNIK